MRILFTSLLAASIVLLARLSLADAPATQPSDEPAPTTRLSLDVIQGLQQHLHGINSVECDFAEQKNLAMLNHTLTIRGHMAMEKPDRLIWIVHDPVKYAVRIEGDEVRQWDEDTNRVDVIHLGGDPTFKAVSEQIQGWFLGDYKSLGGSYDSFLIAQQPIWIAFIPNGQSAVSKLISRIDLTFNAQESYLDTMTMHETGGDLTTIHFTSVRINQPMPDKIWEMPPNDP